MKYRRLGNSELQVSEICLGSWLTFGSGIADEQAIACVERAFEAGINFIDTANVYGRGAAESFLGRVLKDRSRDSYVLATKVYFPMTSQDSGLSRKQILKQLDASLARLETDYIDLYQCHRYDDKTPLEETMHALSDVVAAGKVRYIGFSEWPVDKIGAAQEMTGIERFVSSQPKYSMVQRDIEEDVIAYCSANGIGQIVWSPLAQGVLTGKYRSGQVPPKGSRVTDPKMGSFFPKDFLKPKAAAAIDGLTEVAAAAGLTMAQLALAWVLRQPNVSSAIIGATRPEQVEENAGAAGIVLSDETLASIDTTLEPIIGHQPKRYRLGDLLRGALKRE